MGSKKVLFINEYGFYPELIKGLQSAAYDLTVEHHMRKAIAFIKRQQPDVVVAEFHHEAQFRDRVSNLESMLAQVQSSAKPIRTVVFYDLADQIYLDRLQSMYSLDALLQQPFQLSELMLAIDNL